MSRGFKILTSIFVTIFAVVVISVGISIIQDNIPKTYTLKFFNDRKVLGVVELEVGETISEDKIFEISSKVSHNDDQTVVWSTSHDELKEVNIFNLRETTNLYAYVVSKEYKVNVICDSSLDYELLSDGKIVSGSTVYLKLKNLGTFIPKVMVNDTEIIGDEDYVYPIKVGKGDVDVKVILTEKLTIKPILESNYTYDGTKKEVYYLLYDSLNNPVNDVEVTYFKDGNKTDGIIEAGTYEIVYHYTGNEYVVEDVRCEIAVEKAVYDMSSVTFTDKTYTYDQSEKTLEISGVLPDGVSVAYSTNKLINVGEIEVIAKFTGDSQNYYEITPLKATLKIEKAVYDMSSVTFTDKTYTYDKSEKTLEISGVLPDGVSVTYSTNKLINVGEIEVIAKFTGDSQNYYEITPLKATLKIEKAKLIVEGRNYSIFVGEGLDNVSFASVITGFVGGDTVDDLTGQLVYNCEVTKDSQQGIYPIVISGLTSTNYEIEYINGSVEVLLDSYIISISDDELVKSYNGQTQTFTARLRSKDGYIEGVDFTYTLNGLSFTGAVNVGQYNVVVSYNDEVYGTDSIEVVFEITKAVYDMTNVTFTDKTYTYDRTAKTLVITGGLADGLEVSYSKNTLVNVGEIEVVATFTGDWDNYYKVESIKAILKITPKSLTSSMFDEIDDQTYTGNAIIPNVIGRYESHNLVLGEDFTIAYKNNINAGNASVIITGINNYSGEVELTFIIELSDLSKAQSDLAEILAKYDGSIVNKVYLSATHNSLITYICQSTAITIDEDGNVSVVLKETEQLITVYVMVQNNDAVVIGEVVFSLPSGQTPNFTKISIGEVASLTESSSVVYEVSGIVSNITNTDFGNFYLVDPDTQDKIFVYGLCRENEKVLKYIDNLDGTYRGEFGSNDKSFKSLNISCGDYITMRAIFEIYNKTPEIKGVYVSTITDFTPNVDIEYDDTLGNVEYQIESNEVVLSIAPNAGYRIKSVYVNHDYTDIFNEVDKDEDVYRFIYKYYNEIVIEFEENKEDSGEVKTGWALVTGTSELSVDDQIIIVASESNVAMSTVQNNNNRGQVELIKNNITNLTGVQIITLESGKTSGSFAFNVGNGYLYAASSSKNYLKTQSILTNDSSWKISISANGVATIIAQGSNKRNMLQYNKSSKLFACYEAAQAAVSIYKYFEASQMTDQDKVNADKKDLTIVSSVKDTLILPSKGMYSTITWISNNTDVISITNNVATVTPQAVDVVVKLTATLKLNSASTTKEFSVTVLKYASDKEKILLDIEEIILPDKVSNSLILPVSGSHGSIIEWASGNEEIIEITFDGVVIHSLGEDTVVTLIALYSINDENELVEYEITVTGRTIDKLEQITDYTQIVNGLEIIIVSHDLKQAMGSSMGKAQSSVSFNVNSLSDEILIVTLEEITADVYILNTSEGNLFYSGSDNSISVGSERDEEGQWKFNYKDGNLFEIQNVKYPDRYLQYNASNPRFACYKGTQKNVGIYAKNNSSRTDDEVVAFDIKAFSLPKSVKSGYTLPTSCKYGSSIEWIPVFGSDVFYANGVLKNQTDDNVTLKLYAYFSYGAYKSEKQEYSVIILMENISNITPDLGEYYDGITQTSGKVLLLELRDLIQTTHKKTTSYDDLKKYLPDADQDLDNPDNMILFYTGESIKKQYNCNNWNREHVWPQSLGWFTTSKAGSDMHHLRPCDAKVNSSRGNTKFGESSKYYTPSDEYKGDVARIIFYLFVRYDEADNYTVSSVAESMEMLLRWNELDPVSEHEIYRNEFIYEIQGNRNPFIDNSDYANLIWG